jgi:hypothetical protein
MQNDKKLFLSGIAGKLAVLVGGAIVATGVNASPFAAAVPGPGANTLSLPSAAGLKPLAPKLILKQQHEGFKMIASHDSHSSHSSHASHASHSSHSSSAY